MVFKTAFTRLFFRAKVENLTSIKKNVFIYPLVVKRRFEENGPERNQGTDILA